MANRIPLEHPGVLLKEEFIEAMGLSVYKVSQATGINQTALGQIIKGERRISPLNSLKLSKFFGMSDNFFANLQTQFELDLAKETGKNILGKITPLQTRISPYK